MVIIPLPIKRIKRRECSTWHGVDEDQLARHEPFLARLRQGQRRSLQERHDVIQETGSAGSVEHAVVDR